jgi:hypothetical protein
MLYFPHVVVISLYEGAPVRAYNEMLVGEKQKSEGRAVMAQIGYFLQSTNIVEDLIPFFVRIKDL